jgi:hypothetical protein
MFSSDLFCAKLGPSKRGPIKYYYSDILRVSLECAISWHAAAFPLIGSILDAIIYDRQ